MPLTFKAALPLLALAAAGCQVSVDNQSRANLENAGDAIGNAADSAGAAIGEAADAAGNAVDAGAAKIENTADRVDKGVNVHVNLHDDDKTANHS